MTDNEMRHPIDATWIERAYPSALHPPDTVHMNKCDAYAENVEKEMVRGNMDAFTYDSMRTSDLFETVPVNTQHVAYRVVALGEFLFDSRASVAFTDTFDATPISCGMSQTLGRGKDKKGTYAGVQYMAGVHGSGEGNKGGAALPHCWKPSETEDLQLTSLMVAHVHSVERALVDRCPAYVAYMKNTMEEKHASEYTLTPLGITTSIGTSISYVAGPHTDKKNSNRECIWAAILFICVESVDKWTFYAGTHLYDLPTTPGMARLIILDPVEIKHGTCYTSSETANHRNIGTVLTFNLTMITACETAVNGVSHTSARITPDNLAKMQDAREFAMRTRALSRNVRVFTTPPVNSSILAFDCEGASATILRDFPALLTSARGIYCERDGTAKENNQFLNLMDSMMSRALLMKGAKDHGHVVYMSGKCECVKTMRNFLGPEGYTTSAMINGTQLCPPLFSFELALADGTTKRNGAHEGSEQAITHRLIALCRERSNDAPMHVVEFGGGAGGNTIQIALHLRDGDTLTVYEPCVEIAFYLHQNLDTVLTPTQRKRVTVVIGTLSHTELTLPPFDPRSWSNKNPDQPTWMTARTAAPLAHSVSLLTALADTPDLASDVDTASLSPCGDDAVVASPERAATPTSVLSDDTVAVDESEPVSSATRDSLGVDLSSTAISLKTIRELRKLDKRGGAIIAPSRTAEGYRLPTGAGQTCLVDAVYNGIRVLGGTPSLDKMRSRAMPKLGEVLQASWKSIMTALVLLRTPYLMVEVTSQFAHVDGGPVLAMLRSTSRVFVARLCVTIEGAKSFHAIMLSTVPEEHAPYGKMVDNHGAMRPVYLEKGDARKPHSAKMALRTLVGQNPAVHGRDFAVQTGDVYEIVQA